MDRCFFGERDLAKIDEHLLAWRRIEYMVINAPVLPARIYLACSFQVVYVVPQRLFVAWQALIITVLDELFFKDIVNG